MNSESERWRGIKKNGILDLNSTSCYFPCSTKISVADLFGSKKNVLLSAYRLGYAFNWGQPLIGVRYL
jgi:hypothetical protein